MNTSIPLKSRIFGAIIIFTAFLLLFNGRIAAQVKTQKQDFNVAGRGTFIFEFTLQSVGKATITANWQGAFPAVLTLKDPFAKVFRHKRGKSPLRLEFWVSKQLVEKSGEWKIIFENLGRFKTKGRITINYTAPKSKKAARGWCCKDGRIFPVTKVECRERSGQFFHTREEAEEHCREDHPQPRPEEGWCCKDGRIFPVAKEECMERGGQFFHTREEAEEHCREDHPQPRPEEGWCCKDGRIFPVTKEECMERGGQFFHSREEAEEHCREDHPQPVEHPRPEGAEEGWCCKDGNVFPTTLLECCERRGRFFHTREEAEEHCREDHPQPVEHPRPEGEEEVRPYPAVPSANLEVERLVPLEILEKIAHSHAYEIWGEEIAPGPPFPVADRNGNVYAYVFPYMRGSQHFPGYERIFDQVRNLRLEPGLAKMGEQFGAIYVSAHNRDFPVLMITHYLHPYFLAGDLAQDAAGRFFDSHDVKLEKIYFLNPHEEYFEFISNGKPVLFNVNSLERKSLAEALDVEPTPPRTGEHIKKIEEAWDRATRLTPVGTPAEEAAVTHTVKKILHWKRLPLIPHTRWCVVTTQAHVLGFWDHYAKGSGTFLGYGRFIKYWFEHPIFCHSTSGAHVPCERSEAIHNSVPDIIDVIVDPKTKTWRKGFTSFPDFVSKMYNYTFSSGKMTPKASNGWAWNNVKKEVDNGRPSFWSYGGHMVAAIGYRISNLGQKFVIVYDSYGVTFAQKIKEQNYSKCNGFQWAIPGGGANLDHMIIDSPVGGENLTKMAPYDITWWVWGVRIKKSTISFSADGGGNWTIIAGNVNTNLGKNSYQWLPDKATKKGRIRIYCYTGKNELIAADGSENNFTIKTAALNKWGSWKSLGKPLTGQYGVERVVVGQNQDGRLEVFGIGSDSALWHKYQAKPNSSTWSGWATLGKPPGGLPLSTAAVARNQDGRLEVVAIAHDGALWRRYQSKPNKGPWVGWSSMGKPAGVTKFVSRPVIGQNQDGRLEVFVFGNGALWHSYQSIPNSGSWSAWKSMGTPQGKGKFYAHPAVKKNKDGRLEVFSMAGAPGKGEFQLADTALWHKFQPSPNHKGSWGKWLSMGKPSGASWPAPTVGRNKDGRLEVVVPGGDGALWHKYQLMPNTGPWYGWSSMSHPPGGIKILSQIDAAENKDGRLEVFTFGIRGKGPSSVTAPWHIWQTLPNSGWSQWAGLGEPPGKNFQSLVVGQNKNGKLEVFAIAADDRSLWHIRQE
jgi:hypothetical protein